MMDNFYTSPELYDFLLNHKTDAYGIIRAMRWDMPPIFAKQKLKTGELVVWQKGKMMAWQDVCVESTMHKTVTTKIHTRGRKDILKPQVVIDYNPTIGGVNRANQALTFYPAMRKQQKKYY